MQELWRYVLEPEARTRVRIVVLYGSDTHTADGNRTDDVASDVKTVEKLTLAR